MKSPITTHVLDLSSGKPATGIEASLEFLAGETWHPAGSGVTDADGRIQELTPPEQPFREGTYRLTFETAAYHAAQNRRSFHPRVTIEFQVGSVSDHYHVPLLLSPFGYSTYRGS